MSMLERKLVRVGNSVGVTIPRDYLETLGIKAGAWVMLTLENGELKVKKSDLRERLDAHQKKIERHQRALAVKRGAFGKGRSGRSNMPSERAPTRSRKK